MLKENKVEQIKSETIVKYQTITHVKHSSSQSGMIVYCTL